MSHISTSISKIIRSTIKSDGTINGEYSVTVREIVNCRAAMYRQRKKQYSALLKSLSTTKGCYLRFDWIACFCKSNIKISQGKTALLLQLFTKYRQGTVTLKQYACKTSTTQLNACVAIVHKFLIINLRMF